MGTGRLIGAEGMVFMLCERFAVSGAWLITVECEVCGLLICGVRKNGYTAARRVQGVTSGPYGDCDYHREAVGGLDPLHTVSQMHILHVRSHRWFSRHFMSIVRIIYSFLFS